MNLAIALSLCVATLNLTTAVVHRAISRAPGWRASRAFSLIAFTAGCYSVGNLVFCFAGVPDGVILAGARWNYLCANLHALAWYPFAFGGPEASWRAMPRPVRALGWLGLAVAAFFLVTGLHLKPFVVLVTVPWAGVVYRYAATSGIGDLYGMFELVLFTVPFVWLVRRAWRGERALRLVVAGLTLFYLCAVVELLVANGVLVSISPAELGFLAVVAPTSLQMLRRFINDARRLNELSGRLAGEVRDRTEERDRAESALIESERLAALGRLAAGVGHEINNPLVYLQLSLHLVADHLSASGSPPEVREALADAADGARRIQKVVEGLRTTSRRQDERRPLEPGDVVRAALKVARPNLRHLAALETELPPTPRVRGDEARLVQAVVNLLANAGQAVDRDGAGHITVRTGADGRGEVTIEVEDDGPGIPPEHLAHLAEPYFTTRGTDGGLGLGLFVTRGIMEAHGGRLVFDSTVGGGTRARLVLPALEGAAAPAPPEPDCPEARRAAAPPAPAAPPAAAGTGRRPRLLLVDDEPLVLRLFAQALGDAWEVTCASNGDEALALMRTTAFERVVCDLMMPGRTGMNVADEVARLDPLTRSRMVFLTGGAVTREAEVFLERPDVVHLVKPVEVAALKAVLRGETPPVPSAR